MSNFKLAEIVCKNSPYRTVAILTTLITVIMAVIIFSIAGYIVHSNNDKFDSLQQQIVTLSENQKAYELKVAKLTNENAELKETVEVVKTELKEKTTELLTVKVSLEAKSEVNKILQRQLQVAQEAAFTSKKSQESDNLWE